MLGNVQLQSGCLSSAVHRPWNERNVWLKSSMRTYRCFQASDVGRLMKWTIKLIETLTVSVFHASLLFMPLGKCKCLESHIDSCVRDSLGESGQLFVWNYNLVWRDLKKTCTPMTSVMTPQTLLHGENSNMLVTFFISLFSCFPHLYSPLLFFGTVKSTLKNMTFSY